ncbi:MAG: LLM class flavin-dependent oxidoreductase [Chloroflexi bacterium]|nr:LLM class flavin-dependent oxidoreductase [Chloroflexota bacterium]
MKVNFGITLVPEPYSHFLEWVKLTDQLGYDILGIGDSQSLFRELYVSCTLAALNTKRVRLGPRVSNPLTRHPAVSASAIASVDELAPGRVFLGLGTGDSAILNLGLRPAKMDQLREYILAVKQLYARHETVYQGRTARLTWPSKGVPVYIAAEGPKTLRLAGQIADGVVVGLGLTPELVKEALGYIHAGAREAGRDPKSIDIWWIVKGNIGESREKVVDDMRMALAASAHHAFRFTLEGKHVPPSLVDKVERIKREYRPSEHEQLGAEKWNARLVDELGLKEFLAERFAIAGTPQECVEQIQRCAAAGANQLWISVHVPDRPYFLRTFAEKVIPHFK